MEETYLMRSLMFVPAHNDKLLESAVRRDADVLLLDIEDSVPYPEKQKSRDNIKEFVKRTDLNGKLIFPRVNDRESGELLKDVYQLTINGVHGFTYPKATCGEDIYFFGKLLETIEYEKGFEIGTFKIIPLIETTGAVINIKDIKSVGNKLAFYELKKIINDYNKEEHDLMQRIVDESFTLIQGEVPYITPKTLIITSNAKVADKIKSPPLKTTAKEGR